MARLAQPIEDMVVEAVLSALEHADLTPYLRKGLNGEENGVVEAIQQDEQALAMLADDYYVNKVIDRNEFLSTRATLQQRLESNRVKLLAHQNAAVLGAITAGAEVRRQWPSRPLEWRRSVIGAIVDHVKVHPSPRSRFDPTKIEIVWRA